MKKLFLIVALCAGITLAGCGGKSEKNTGADTSAMSVDPSGGDKATGSGSTGTSADTIGMGTKDSTSSNTPKNN